MIANGYLLLCILLSSFVTGLVIFFLDESQVRLRTWLNLLGASAKIVFVLFLLEAVYRSEPIAFAYQLAPGIELNLSADPNAVFFVTLSTLLWFLTTLYAVGYLEHSTHRSRFFGFFSLCVSATTGVALAGNLVSFLTFYELLTLSTYPLVVHRGTADSMRAGKIYLAYTLTGGALLLLAVAWLQSFAGPVTFQLTGAIGHVATSHRFELQVLFALFVIGLGVKTAIVPLHGWLPKPWSRPRP